MLDLILTQMHHYAGLRGSARDFSVRGVLDLLAVVTKLRSICDLLLFGLAQFFFKTMKKVLRLSTVIMKLTILEKLKMCKNEVR